VTGVCGLRAVDACMNEMALGELAGELDSRRNEWVDARLEGRDGRLGVEESAAVNGTCCWSLRCLCIISRIVDSICGLRAHSVSANWVNSATLRDLTHQIIGDFQTVLEELFELFLIVLV
jgi:hypothetical protein